MLAVVFQASVLPLGFSSMNIPDLILIMLVSGVAIFGIQSMWTWIIVSGIILDLFSFRIIGTNVVSFMIFSYAVSFFSRRLILGEKTGGVLISGTFIMFMTFFQNIWVQLVSFNFELEKIWGIIASWGWDIIFKAVLNLILFFIFILLFKRMKNKLSQSKNLFV